MAAREHFIKPEQSFDQIGLDQASLPERRVIPEHADRFLADRFKVMTSREQANLLAEIDVRIGKERLFDPANPPFQFEVMREKMGLTENQRITKKVAGEFYLDYSSSGRRMWLTRLLRDPLTRPLVEEKIFENLSKQLPAFLYTLAHIFEGGHYGLLTARGARENHRQQINVISESIGFSPQVELIYYVNDEKLSKRLKGDSADKKATVQVNFANGLKEDEDGHLVPMTVGKRFDEIVFIDDEDKNLRAAMYCVVRDACSNVLYEAGLRHRTPGIEDRISERARKISDAAYSRAGVGEMQKADFWVSVVDEMLREFTKQTGRLSDRSSMIADLRAAGKWLPDVLKVLDGRNIPAEESIARIKLRLADPEPLQPGSKRSLVLDDIDGNLLSVNARFYVRLKSDPKGEQLLVLDQAQFAEHPTAGYWIEQVAKKTGIAPGELDFSFEHFREPEAIEQDILRAMFKNKILANPYGGSAS